ncbi:hypothetical protein KKH23_07055 [Patescibacteria group bacterium]|uniref:Uncharacterized protein n=1 Tax=viral metagenome TaxID=1070528 RepID=A0A6M3M4D2_9ZZZZ|nr:hypothetical protein [Patescibacteria group bacterium]
MKQTVKPGYMPPILSKKQQKKRKAKSCSTPGKDKGGSCSATSLQKAMCKYNRSYKYPEYAETMEIYKKYWK